MIAMHENGDDPAVVPFRFQPVDPHEADAVRSHRGCRYSLLSLFSCVTTASLLFAWQRGLPRGYAAFVVIAAAAYCSTVTMYITARGNQGSTKWPIKIMAGLGVFVAVLVIGFTVTFVAEWLQ